MITATYVRDGEGYHGNAKLYRLSEPVPYGYSFDEVDDRPMTDHVIISAINAPFSGPETYIFPANAEGQVVDFGEMDGSFRGDLSHETAITEAGWVLV